MIPFDNGEPPDLLYGLEAIAKFLGLTERQAQYRLDQGAFPSWREGRVRCARRSTIAACMAERELSAVRKRGAE